MASLPRSARRGVVSIRYPEGSAPPVGRRRRAHGRGANLNEKLKREAARRAAERNCHVYRLLRKNL